MKIKCCVVDDEPLALSQMKRYVAQTDFLELAASFDNGIDAQNFLRENAVDLLFLDIQMPQFSGLDLSKLVDTECKIIFTTAFEKYALQGYKVNALDYLLKPISYSEFLEASQKALAWFSSKNNASFKVDSGQDYIFVKSEYKQVKILFNEILYIEGLKDYVKIWLADQPKPVLSIMSLKKLEDLLPSDFMRVHRSYIVSLDKITAIERGQILVGDNVRITVAEQYKKKFSEFLSRNSYN
ncbi:MAG: response regulator transcription factor [Bacteroidetes bacterium]|nr:response regulator transcription factor [Bacteroidota bacterium]